MTAINFYGDGFRTVSIWLIHCHNAWGRGRRTAVVGADFVVLAVRLALSFAMTIEAVDFADYHPIASYSVIWWSRTRALNSLWPDRSDSNRGTHLLSPRHRDCDPFSVHEKRNENKER